MGSATNGVRLDRYDFDRLRTLSDALNRRQHYRYSRHDQLIEVTDGKGQRPTYQWQQGDRLQQKTSAVGQTDYHYNALGQTTHIEHPHSANTYHYDAAQRLRHTHSQHHLHSPEHTLTSTYSAAWQINRSAAGEGWQTDYRYDATGRLLYLQDGDGRSARFSYDDGGRLTRQTLPNGWQSHYFYDAADQLENLQITHLNSATSSLSQVFNQVFRYDNLGRLTLQTRTLNGDRHQHDYRYDPLGRLIEERHQHHGTITLNHWHYDAFGNRTLSDIDGQRQLAIYDAAQQLIEIRQDSPSGLLREAFIYDDNGQLIQHCTGANVSRQARQCNGESIRLYTYNGDRQLTAILQNYQALAHFLYDAHGRRIVHVDAPQGTAHYRHYQGDQRIADYLADSPAPVHRYLYTGLDQPLLHASFPANGDTGEHHSYLQDGLGNIVGVTDRRGQLSATRHYDAWGTLLSHSGTFPGNLGYKAREHDHSGLIYHRARYYHPPTGRFTQPDPLGFIDGINTYAYAVNSPLNFSDPMVSMAKIIDPLADINFDPQWSKKLRTGFLF